MLNHGSTTPGSGEGAERELRILHVVHSANPAGGGVIEAIVQLASANTAEGHNVELASLDAAGAPYLRDIPLRIHALGRGGGFGYSQQFASWLRQQHDRFDAVIVNGLWQYSSLGVWQTLRHSRTPYFVFPHGMLDPWFREAFPLKHFKKLLYWNMAERRVLRDARSVLYTCEEERKLAPLSFGHFDHNPHVVHLGTAMPAGDTEAQKEALFSAFPKLRNRRIVLFLGRLHPKKAPDLLIRAFRQIRDAGSASIGGGHPLHLVLAGPCADATYLKKLEALASAQLSAGQVTFTGMLRGDIKWGALHAAEVFVLPSHQENFGLAVAEALAVGLPVLISRKVNIWREIQQDGAGLVENDDLTGTSRLLSQWFSMTPEQKCSMRASAKSCFNSRFEIGRAGRNLARFLSMETPEQTEDPMRNRQTRSFVQR